jgi:hypothetical protein
MQPEAIFRLFRITVRALRARDLAEPMLDKRQ